MTSMYGTSSQHCVPSPDGALIAALQQSGLSIFTYTGALLQSYTLPADFTSKCRFIRWSRLRDTVQHSAGGYDTGQADWQCNRILLADNDSVRVYDVHNPNWSATIDRPFDNLGGIRDIAFGNNSDEVLVFSEFGIKLIIWSLVTSRGVEVKDPKYLTQCYSYRPETGHMALLIRPGAQDLLMILNPGDHALFKSVETPTIDAQAVAWSPDGRWLAVRDAASCGQKILIYTADGHLFKIYSEPEVGGDIGLGVKVSEWKSSTGSLVLGDYNDTVTILERNKFSPLANLPHPSTISLPEVSIWQEQLDISKERTYSIAPQPASPPVPSITSAKTTNFPRGISILALNADGSYLATKDDSLPTTVWIWSLNTGTAAAILIHHSPVKHVAWHPTEPDLLLVHCAIPQPYVHLWKSSWDVPRVISGSLSTTGGKLEANWVLNPEGSDFNLLLSSAHQYTNILLSGSGEVIPQTAHIDKTFAESTDIGAEAMFDEGNSFDLSPIKITRDETVDFEDENETSGFGMDNELVDDTFHYRRHVRANG